MIAQFLIRKGAIAIFSSLSRLTEQREKPNVGCTAESGSCGQPGRQRSNSVTVHVAVHRNGHHGDGRQTASPRFFGVEGKCFEAERRAGREARLFMHEQPIVIFEYSDKQAIEDGVLVSVPGEGKVNRVTRAVFDHFAKPMGSSPAGEVTDITPLQDAIRAMLKIEPDEDGMRTGTYEGKKLWILPNEVEGLTLLFPEDY